MKSLKTNKIKCGTYTQLNLSATRKNKTKAFTEKWMSGTGNH